MSISAWKVFRIPDIPGLRIRFMAAILLACCAVLLVLLNVATEKIGQRAGRGRATAGRIVPAEDAGLSGINTVVDTLLARYQIDRRSVKSWYVQTQDKRNIRLERRVIVPPDFVSMKFNLDLNRMVSAYGARAVATERTRESTVTMHIIKDKMIVQSISFVMQSRSDR